MCCEETISDMGTMGTVVQTYHISCDDIVISAHCSPQSDQITGKESFELFSTHCCDLSPCSLEGQKVK